MPLGLLNILTSLLKLKLQKAIMLQPRCLHESPPGQKYISSRLNPLPKPWKGTMLIPRCQQGLSLGRKRTLNPSFPPYSSRKYFSNPFQGERVRAKKCRELREAHTALVWAKLLVSRVILRSGRGGRQCTKFRNCMHHYSDEVRAPTSYLPPPSPGHDFEVHVR
jgi:hypothetical protein